MENNNIRFYKTKFKHQNRFQNVKDVLQREIPVVDIDLFIYCMDLYKIYLFTFTKGVLDETV